MSRIKDTDYLFISPYIRSLESGLLSRERMERMLDARSDDEALKLLSECGYDELETLSAPALEEALAAGRIRMFRELSQLAPDPRIVDFFRIKYDYHNVKALIKAEAVSQDGERLLIDAGRVEAKKLADALRQSDLRSLSDTLRRAVTEARETLAATGDPQYADFILDRACYQELGDCAAATGSSFLTGYLRLTIDAVNLRSVVRTARMNKGVDFLRRVLIPGGNVEDYSIAAVMSSSGALSSVFTGQLRSAAELGDAAVRGGRLTEFERACDDALTAYLRDSRLISFGEAVPIAYVAAKENEISALRVILTGRMAGVPADSIRERLREAYV